MCRDGRRQIARHTDWKRTGGALGITRVDACAPFGFGLRRIFPPKAFAFFGTSTTNTHNGLHTDARRTFPIAQAPHRARRSPRALIKSRDKAKGNPGLRRGFLFAVRFSSLRFRNRPISWSFGFSIRFFRQHKLWTSTLGFMHHGMTIRLFWNQKPETRN